MPILERREKKGKLKGQPIGRIDGVKEDKLARFGRIQHQSDLNILTVAYIT
jgi:hypothetical protein